MSFHIPTAAVLQQLAWLIWDVTARFECMNSLFDNMLDIYWIINWFLQTDISQNIVQETPSQDVNQW